VRMLGVVADTHCERPDGSDLPEAVVDALRPADLIVHCGDLMRIGVLDRLREAAPVVAVRSRADPKDAHEALYDPPHRLVVEEVRIGVLSRPSDLLEGVGDDTETDIRAVRAQLPRVFPYGADIVVFRGSHRDRVHLCDGTLLIDAGSPTFWSAGRATVVLLAVDGSTVEIEVVDITRKLAIRPRLDHFRAVLRQRRWDRRARRAEARGPG
jgi:putative phosphoesterase